jgi:hypothetical protein
VIQGNNPEPGALVLRVSTGASEPKCFLTSMMNLAKVIPKIELEWWHSDSPMTFMGIHLHLLVSKLGTTVVINLP